MHLIQGPKENNDISDSDFSHQSDSEIRSFSIQLQPDSFTKLQAEDDEADSEPKSSSTIHVIHNSIYDYFKKPDNGEIACIVGKMIQITLNDLHSAAIYGRPILDSGGEVWRAQYRRALKMQRCKIIETSSPAIMSTLEDLASSTFIRRDLEGIDMLHIVPLVVTLEIANIIVKRILIDGGGSVKISNRMHFKK